MSLKDLTKDKHTAAENTKFMKAVFNNTMSLDVWADFTYNKMMWYSAIEQRAKDVGLLDNLEGIERHEKLLEDYRTMTNNTFKYKIRDISIEYRKYILSIETPEKLLAHLYTWHMGDLHGGQMIKKVIDAPHSSLEFENPTDLITNMREKLHDGLADEANIAFDWAIKIMESYDNDLE